MTCGTIVRASVTGINGRWQNLRSSGSVCRATGYSARSAGAAQGRLTHGRRRSPLQPRRRIGAARLRTVLVRDLGRGETLARFFLRSTLAVGARDLPARREKPVAVALEHGGELVVHLDPLRPSRCSRSSGGTPRRSVQSRNDGLGVPSRYAQQGKRRSIGASASLLPVPEGGHAHADEQCELRLRDLEFGANGPHISGTKRGDSRRPRSAATDSTRLLKHSRPVLRMPHPSLEFLQHESSESLGLVRGQVALLVLRVAYNM